MFPVGSLVEKLLLLSVSGSVALGVAEIALRVAPGLMPEEAQLRVHWRKGMAQNPPRALRDPYIGFLYPPHEQRTVDQSDVRFTYTTDQSGFRNPSPWPSTADAVVVGDSWVFGYGVDEDQAWTTLVANGLPLRHLINLGLTGAGAQQALRVYERFGIPLRPKLLVFGLFSGNDIQDDHLFSRWLEVGSPGNYDVWRFFQGNVPSRTSSLLRQSHLLTTLKELRNLRHSPFFGRTVHFTDGSRLRLAPGTLLRAVMHAHVGDPDFERVLAAIERMQKTAEANGTKFLVLLFPTKEEVYLPILGDRAPAITAAFAPELRRRGIPYLDLTGPFQARAHAGERLYFEVDGHANQAGNRLMAETVLRYVQEHARRLGLSPLASTVSENRVDEWRER